MASSAAQRSPIVLASTFYTPALEKPFTEAIAAKRGDSRLICVPYNQLLSFLLDPASLLPGAIAARIVLLVRLEDVIRPELANRQLADSEIVEVFHERTDQLLSLFARSNLRLTVLICPSGRSCYDLGFLQNALRIAEHKLAAALRIRQRHLVVEWFEWPDFAAGVKTGEWLNVPGDRLGHVPFTPKALQAVATYFKI